MNAGRLIAATVVISVGILFSSLSFAAESEPLLPDVKANKVILQFSGTELQPAKLSLNKLDSSVFFVNRSAETPVTIQVDFRGKKLHCHSKNLEMTEAGFLSTKQPIASFDFAILCFPSAGSYPYEVKEVGSKGRQFKGEIVVNE
jgi:hypothetical protein